jgi:alpha-galactosidase
MLHFWLGLWREHRDVLLDGALEPLHPEANYPVVLARTESKLITAAYGNAVVPLDGEIPSTLLVVNGTLEEGVVLHLEDDQGTRVVDVRDCRGRVARKNTIGLRAGLLGIEIPPSGVALFK